MIREWWTRTMDRQRVAAATVGVLGLAGCIVAGAAAEIDLWPPSNWGGALGATVGIATRQYIDHRARGENGLKWAVLWFVGGLLFVAAMLSLIGVLTPVLADRGVPAPVVLVLSLVALFVSALLGERDSRGRLVVVLVSMGMALFLGGFLALEAGMRWQREDPILRLFGGLAVVAAFPVFIIAARLSRTAQKGRLAAYRAERERSGSAR